MEKYSKNIPMGYEPGLEPEFTDPQSAVLATYTTRNVLESGFEPLLREPKSRVLPVRRL